MNLDELLGVFDHAAANLTRLDAVWERAHPLLPTGPAVGSSPEYDDLQRAWHDLLSGLPPIDGWRVDVDLPDKDRVGQDFIDYAEISEPPFALYDELEQPAR